MSVHNPAAAGSRTATRSRLGAGTLLVLSALIVWVAVFVLLDSGSAPEVPAGPAMTDRQGRSFPLLSLQGRVWIVSILRGDCSGGCGQVLAELDRLRGELPAATGLLSVTLPTLDGALSAELEGAPWTVLQGHADAFRALTVDYLGLPPADLLAVEDGTSDALVATLGRSGHVRSAHPIAAATGLDGDVRRAILADARFLRSLESRPPLHAALNAASATLLLVGFLLVRRGRIRSHVACMVLATLVTLSFLVSYFHYHYHTGSTAFQGEGWVRPLYFGLLLSHTVLAAFVVPLAATLIFHALRRRFDRHRDLARWTLPIWLYVSVTGVLVYFMLYVWFPGP